VLEPLRFRDDGRHTLHPDYGSLLADGPWPSPFGDPASSSALLGGGRRGGRPAVLISSTLPCPPGGGLSAVPWFGCEAVIGD